MTSKTSIKAEMAALDKRDFNWYNSLTEDEVKSLSMWTLQRYASACESKVPEIQQHYLIMINELCNVHFNTLRNHPELQWRLMQVAGVGTAQYHPWIAPGKRKSAKGVNAKMAAFYLSLNPYLSDDEVNWVVKAMSKEEKTLLLEEAGIEKSKIKDYLK